MMNDHNLDDLIIDTPDKKSGKAKGLLTIIALLIVVLIVAIILTKIILKDPENDRAVLADNETEMISPELTLQATDDEDKEDEKALSSMIQKEINDHETSATLDIKPEKSKEMTSKPTKEEKTTSTTPTVTTQKTKVEPISKTEPPKAKEVVKIPAPAAKPVVKTAPKPKLAPAVHETFYIQVGSFSQTPSSHLIATVKKQGFHYKVMRISDMNKVLIGPYPSREAVDRIIPRVRSLINKNAFVVKR